MKLSKEVEKVLHEEGSFSSTCWDCDQKTGETKTENARYRHRTVVQCEECRNASSQEKNLDFCEPGQPHEYAPRECVACGHIFCFSCCGATNVHQGGKYEPDFMNCPNCNKDYYEE